MDILIFILGLFTIAYLSNRLKIFELCIFIAAKEYIIEPKDVVDYIYTKFQIKLPYAIIRIMQKDLKEKHPELEKYLRGENDPR